MRSCGANDPGHHRDDADDANAPIVAYRVRALLARLSTQGVSACRELTVGPITYLNAKFDTDG